MRCGGAASGLGLTAVSGERVTVFGAGGAVGRVVLRAVQAEPGLRALACLHRAPGAGVMAETRFADAADLQQAIAALEGCSLAVNVVGGPHARLAAATETLCRAARATGLRRLVHVSSMAVYGAAAAGLVRESAPMAETPTPYEAAKIGSEAAMRAHMAAGHEAVILRPGLVFGPDSTQWAWRMARLLRARRLGDLGPAGDGFCNLTHEADLGRAIVAALLVPRAAGLAFNLATPSPPTWNAFLVMFARALGAVPVRRMSGCRLAVEGRIAPALQAVRLATRRAGLARAPDPIPPSLLRLFGQRLRLDGTLADEILAIARTPDADGIPATALALRA